MEELYERLQKSQEYYAAELICNQDRSPLYRYSKAVSAYLKNAALTPYKGGKLYPCGRNINMSAQNAHIAVRPEYSYTLSCNMDLLKEKCPEAAEFMEKEHFGKVAPILTPHHIGGSGYTHSFINYRRILKDGLTGYIKRVTALPDCDFKEAMLILLDGIEAYRQRCISYLTEINADASLICALSRVPMHSPENIYEAIVAWNFVYYIDGCDDIGGLDRALYPYWKGEDIRPVIRALYENIDENDAWSMPLGPDYNELTVQLIDACHSIRRPSIQLLVTEDMPDEVWQAAYRSLASGCGQPALYNWHLFKREINSRLPEVTEDDIKYIAFGGCTETMIEGLSNVGSDDAGINTALIFDAFMREKLSTYDTFDSFLDGYLSETERVIAETCEILEQYRKTRAEHRPQPVRTLFIDDCIDKMLDFNAGGARYNWSVMNVAGLINVIDSMVVIKRLIFDEKAYSPKEFIQKLDERDPVFLAKCARVPKHGNDVSEVNEIASVISNRVYSEFERHTCTPGGRYFPVSNQFTTYEYAGLNVNATPDGRDKGEPLCDSCGAVYGRDKMGPTAMLSSVASLNLPKVLGTPVTNIRIARKNIPTLLKPLVKGFFEMGGMQLQVTSASKEELLDALDHPEKHENLIVRIGGYSEYFNRLTDVLKKTVIERTEY